MASIGTFKKSGQEFQGEIVTLSLKSKGVRIVPETTGPATTPPVIGSMSAESRSAPPGQSAPTRAATISRSSSTIRASPLRSTPTLSRTARPSTSSGRAAASRTATKPAVGPARFAGRGFRMLLPVLASLVPKARSLCHHPKKRRTIAHVASHQPPRRRRVIRRSVPRRSLAIFVVLTPPSPRLSPRFPLRNFGDLVYSVAIGSNEFDVTHSKCLRKVK